MKKRNSIEENDHNQKNNVFHDVHDDDDNHYIVDDDEHGNQVQKDIGYVHTIEEKNSVRLFVIIATMKN